MNAELTFRNIFVVLYIVLMIIRYYYTAKTRTTKRSIQEQLGEASRWEGKPRVALRFVVFPLWIAPLILYVVLPDWMAQFTLPLPIWLRWIAVGVATVAVALLIWAYHTLGKQYSPDLDLTEEHVLVTNGPYRWIRHPMYAAYIAFMIAVAVESANWLVALLNAPSIALVYSRVSKEEAMMIERFGDEYRTYVKRTGRLLPRLRAHTDNIGQRD